MATINHAFFSLGLSFVLCAGCTNAASDDELIPVSSVTVTAARPGKSDFRHLRTILGLGAASDKEIEECCPVYVVKIFTRLQPTAAATVLSIGTSEIPQYGTFSRGLFVRIYDPKKISAFAGQPVTLIRKGTGRQQPFVDPGAPPRFPALQPVDSANRKSVDEVLKGS